MFAAEYNDGSHTFKKSDDERAPLYYLLPTDECALAETLPEDLQEREFPNQRKPMDEILLQGGFEA